jgi:hypothetical protein
VAQRLTHDVSFDDYPRRVKHHHQHKTAGPHHDLSAFEIGLDLMFEGLKENHKTPGSATKKRKAKRLQAT